MGMTLNDPQLEFFERQILQKWCILGC